MVRTRYTRAKKTPEKKDEKSRKSEKVPFETGEAGLAHKPSLLTMKTSSLSGRIAVKLSGVGASAKTPSYSGAGGEISDTNSDESSEESGSVSSDEAEPSSSGKRNTTHLSATKSGNITKSASKKDLAAGESSVKADTAVVKKRGRPKLSPLEKKDKFNKQMVILDQILLSGIDEFRLFYTQYVQSNFNLKMRKQIHNKEVRQAISERVEKYLHLMSEIAKKTIVEPGNLHSRNYRSVEARSMSVQDDIQRDHDKRSGQSVATATTSNSQQQNTSSGQSASFQLFPKKRQRQNTNIGGSVLLETDTDVNDATVAIGIIDALERRKVEKKTEFPSNMHDIMNRYKGIETYIKLLQLYKAKLEREKIDGIEYSDSDKELDRFILRTVLPECVRDLKRYEHSMFMSMCLRKEVAAISEIGFKQFFETLRNVMNDNGETQVWLTKVGRKDLDMSRSDLEFEDLVEILTKLIAVESLEMAIMLLYHLEGRWTFCRDFLMTWWLDRKGKEPHGKYKSSLLKVEMVKGIKYVRGNDPSCPISDEFIQKEVMKWRYINTNGLLEDCEFDESGKPLVEKGKRKYDPSVIGGDPNVMDLDDVVPVVKTLKMEVVKQTRGRGSRGGKSTFPKTSRASSVSTPSIDTERIPAQAALTTASNLTHGLSLDEIRDITLNACSRSAIEKAYQRSLKLMLNMSYYNVEPEKLLPYGYIISRPRKFFHANPNPDNDEDNNLMEFVLSLVRVSQEYYGEYDFWYKVLGPDSNLSNYTGKFAELLNSIQDGNPGDQRYSMGLTFPEFARDTVKLAMLPSRCNMKASNYYIGAVTKGITDKKPFLHFYFKCTDPWCNIRAYFIIPDQPQPGMKVRIVISVVCTSDDCPPFGICPLDLFPDRSVPEAFDKLVESHWNMYEQQKTTGNVLDLPPEDTLNFLNSPAVAPYDTIDTIFKKKAGDERIFLPFSIRKSTNKATGAEEFEYLDVQSKKDYESFRKKIAVASKNFSKRQQFKSTTINGFLAEIKTAEIDSGIVETVPVKVKKRLKRKKLVEAMAELRLEVPEHFKEIVKQNQKNGYEYCLKQRGCAVKKTEYTIEMHRKAIAEAEARIKEAQKKGEEWQEEQEGLEAGYSSSEDSGSESDIEIPGSVPKEDCHTHLQSGLMGSKKSEKIQKVVEDIISSSSVPRQMPTSSLAQSPVNPSGGEETSSHSLQRENMLDLTIDEELGMVNQLNEPWIGENVTLMSAQQKSPALTTDGSSGDESVESDNLNTPVEEKAETTFLSGLPHIEQLIDKTILASDQGSSSSAKTSGKTQETPALFRNVDQLASPVNIFDQFNTSPSTSPEQNEQIDSSIDNGSVVDSVDGVDQTVYDLMQEMIDKIEDDLLCDIDEENERYGTPLQTTSLTADSATVICDLGRGQETIKIPLTPPSEVPMEFQEIFQDEEPLAHNTTDDSIQDLLHGGTPHLRQQPLKKLSVHDILDEDTTIKFDLLERLVELERSQYEELVHKILQIETIDFPEITAEGGAKPACEAAGLNNIARSEKTISSVYKHQKKSKLAKKVNAFIRDHDISLPQTITDMIQSHFGDSVEDLPVSKSRFDPLSRRNSDTVSSKVIPFLSTPLIETTPNEIDVGICVVENQIDERLTSNGITNCSANRQADGELMTRSRGAPHRFIPSQQHFTVRDTVKLLEDGPPEQYDQLCSLEYSFPVHMNPTGIQMMKLFARCLKKLPYGTQPCNPGIEQIIFDRMDLEHKIENCGTMFIVTMFLECNSSGHLVTATLRLSQCVNWEKTFLDSKYDIPEYVMEIIKARILQANPDICGLRVSKYIRENKNVVVGWMGKKILEIWCEQEADYLIITNIERTTWEKATLLLFLYNFRVTSLNMKTQLLEVMAATLKPQFPHKEISISPKLPSQLSQDDWHSSGAYCLAYVAHALKNDNFSQLVIKPDRLTRSRDLRKKIFDIFNGRNVESILASPMCTVSADQKTSDILISMSTSDRDEYTEQKMAGKLSCFPNCKLLRLSTPTLKKVILCKMCNVYYHTACLRGLYINAGSVTKGTGSNPPKLFEEKFNDYFICCICMGKNRGPLRLEDGNSDFYLGLSLHNLIYEQNSVDEFTVKDVYDFSAMLSKDPFEVTEIVLYDRFLDLASSNKKKLKTGLATLPCWLTNQLFDDSGLVSSDIDSHMYVFICQEIRAILCWRDEIVLFPTVQGQMFMVVCYKKTKKVIIFNPLLRTQSTNWKMEHELKFTGAVVTTIVGALRFIDMNLVKKKKEPALWNGYIANQSPFCLWKYESMAICAGMFYQMSAGLPFHYLSSISAPFWFQYIFRTVLTKAMQPDITKSEMITSYENADQLETVTPVSFAEHWVGHERINQVRIQKYEK